MLMLLIAINIKNIKAQIVENIKIFLIVYYYIGTFIIYSKQIN